MEDGVFENGTKPQESTYLLGLFAQFSANVTKCHQRSCFAKYLFSYFLLFVYVCLSLELC